MYQINIGIKLKVDLLRETADDANPTITCIVETYMLKKEEITVLGYETVFRENLTN